MPFCKMKWPKSKEEPKLGIGGVCHGDAVPQCTDLIPPNVKLMVQPLFLIEHVAHMRQCYTELMHSPVTVHGAI